MLETSKILENVQKTKHPFRLVNIINTDVEICLETIHLNSDSATVHMPAFDSNSEYLEVLESIHGLLDWDEKNITRWMAHSILESTEFDQLHALINDGYNDQAFIKRMGNVHRVVRLDNDFNNDLNLGGICSVDGLTYFIYARITDSEI